MEKIELQYVTLGNGETLAYEKAGSGENILLLVHGNLSSSTHWYPLIDVLHNQYKIYAVQMRGFDNSSYINRADTIIEYAHDLKLFADALGITRFNLSGWSFGGAVSMQFASDYPQYLNKLVLLSSVNYKGLPLYKKDSSKKPIIGDFITTKEELKKDLDSMIDAVSNNYRPLIEKVLEVALFNVTKPTVEQLNQYVDIVFKQRNLLDVNYALVNFNISNEHNGVKSGTGAIDKIIAPTLVIHGLNDLIIPPNVAQEIKSGLGHKAKLVIYDDCGHFPLVDKLNEICKEYIEFLG